MNERSEHCLVDRHYLAIYENNEVSHPMGGSKTAKQRNGFCCTNRGLTTLNLRTSKNIYTPNEPVNIIADIDNSNC